jgi:hypothetical protein
MTAKVISLCDFRRNREEGKRLRSESGPGIPSQEFCDKTYPGVEDEDILNIINDIQFDPLFEVDPDDY